MKIREAIITDIPGIQVVRNAVKENTLSDPSLVPDADVADYITRRGGGWVGEAEGIVCAFAIVSLIDHNVWALFVHPDQEKKGWGRLLHDQMLDWYFAQTNHALWLSTTPGTRADQFYRKAGWKETGAYGKAEIRFEMSVDEWRSRQVI